MWTLVAPISSPRDAVGVCILGDRLYAVGGYDGQQYLNEVESYDPQSNEWTKVRGELPCYCRLELCCLVRLCPDTFLVSVVGYSK